MSEELQGRVQEAREKARKRFAEMKRAVHMAQELIDQIEKQAADPNVNHLTLPEPKALLAILKNVTFVAEAGIYPLATLYYAHVHPKSWKMPWRAYWSTTNRGFRLCTDPQAKEPILQWNPGAACREFLAREGILSGMAGPWSRGAN